MLSIVNCQIDGHSGLELFSIDDYASVADLFVPIQAATDDPDILKPDHRLRYATCAGCANNCCRRYAIMPDWLTVQALCSSWQMNLQSFTKKYLRLEQDQTFAEFKGRRCPFLDLQSNLCNIYFQRPAFCRFYLCTPSGEKLEKLKSQVLLLGEIALSQHLVSAGLGSVTWQRMAARNHELFDKPHSNPFNTAIEYENIILRDCCSDRLWDWLQTPIEQTQGQTYQQWLAIK